MGITPTGIDHQTRFRANGFAGGFHNGFIGCRIAATKRSPANLERTKALRLDCQQMSSQLVRLIHQQRRIRLHALPVTTSQKPPDWLASGFSEQIPQCDIDAADGVCD